MNAAAPGAPATVLPETALPETETLERALARPQRLRLRFEPALEAAYERDTGPARTIRQILCNFVGLASFWLVSASDRQFMPEIAALLVPLRAAVGATALALILLQVAWRRTLGGRGRETITALATLAIAGYGVVVAHGVGSTGLVMRLSPLILICLHAGLVARLGFGFSLAINLATWCAYAGLARADSPEARDVVASYTLLFGMTLGFCAIGNHLTESRERRGWLLRALDARRERALQDDAEALRSAAVRDGLTQVFNRRRFDDALDARWQAALATGARVDLLLVDIDHFKGYNDRYGHPAGDDCLIRVARAIDAVAARAGGMVARIGGEEFALLLPALPDAAAGAADDRCEQRAAEVVEAVRALALPHAGSKPGGQVTVSVGAASIAAVSDVPPAGIVAAADVALYAAKAGGRDRWARSDAAAATAAVDGAVAAARTASMPLAPAPFAETAPPAAPASPIDILTGLLRQQRRIDLRFPAALEHDYQERQADRRRRLLFRLMVVGTLLMNGYVVLCAPVLGDVAALLRDRVLAASVLGLIAIAAVLRRPCRWQVREGAFSGLLCGYGLTILATESLATAPTVYTATVAICLLPMFGSLIATLPFGISLAPAVVVCVAVGVLMNPGPGPQAQIWLVTLQTVCSATLYALAGGYLLDRSRRRAWLLDRLRSARLEVLGRNTETLQRLVHSDPLTGLANRRHFDLELARLAERGIASRRPLALLIVDIDHFKRYNDSYGHPAGDDCLRRVATALADGVDRLPGPSPTGTDAAVGALAARLGGEEFGILLPGFDASAALAAARRLQLRIGELEIPHRGAPAGRRLTVSVGSASRVLDVPTEARLLLADADAALYRAKAMGRDQAAA